MQRRTLIQTALVCAVSSPAQAVAANLSSNTQAGRKFRFGHLHPPESAIHQGLMEATRVLEKSSAGKLILEVFPSSQLGTQKEMQNQLMEGSLDFIIDSAAAMANYLKSLSLLEAPFIARDWNHLTMMYESGFARREFVDLEKRRGIVRLGVWYYGRRHFTTTNVPLRTATDVRGLKLRVPEVPFYLDMVNTLGATPTPMSLSAVYASLKSGATDGQENPLPTIFNNKFFEVQKYLNLTGHIMLALMPLTNVKLWNGLNAQEKTLIKQAFEEGGRVSDQLTRKQEEDVLTQLKAKGMQVVESDRDSFRALMETLYPKYADTWGLGAWQAMKLLK